MEIELSVFFYIVYFLINMKDLLFILYLEIFGLGINN